MLSQCVGRNHILGSGKPERQTFTWEGGQLRERQPNSKMVLGAWCWSFLLFFLHGFRIPQATEDRVPRWGWLCVHNRRETVWTEIQLHWGMSIVSSRGQPSRFWIPFREVAEYFFLTCKFMFSQVKRIERRQSFSLGMSNLKKISSIFAYKDWNSCCPLRKYWKNLSMTHWNHTCYCSNSNNGFSIIQYHRRNITGYAIEDRALEAMKY